MAGIDASIPLAINVPDFDVSKPLNFIQQYQLHGQQIRKQEGTYNALQDYGKALKDGDPDKIKDSIARVGAVDPEHGKVLLGLHQGVRQAKAQDDFGRTHDPNTVAMFPDVLRTVEEAKAISDKDQRDQTLHRLDVGGRHAEGYLRNPTVESWNEMLDKGLRDGVITQEHHDQLKNKPNAIQAMKMRAAGATVTQAMESSGEAAANRPHVLGPESTLGIPSQMMFGKDSTATTVTPMIGGKTPGAPVAPEASKDPVYNSIPKTNYDHTTPTGPGIVRQGIDPTILHAKQQANEHYTKEIQPAADASAKAKGELQVIRSALEKQKEGSLETGATAGIRETAAGLIYEAARLVGDPKAAETAHGLTGINPTTADIYGKASTRLGFDMSREQGAREAVQVLQYAFRANPNLFNTKEGNLQVTGILEGVADWKVDRANYANKWLSKNGNLVGFDSWWNTEHPVEQYTSRAYPSQMPTNPKDLKKGVVYEGVKKNGEEWKGAWDPETRTFN